MGRVGLKQMIGLVLCIYPLAIYFIAGALTSGQLAIGLLLLLAARVGIAAWLKAGSSRRELALAALLLAAAVVAWLFESNIKLQWLRVYPVLLSFLMFAMFFISLFIGKPVVERIARIFRRDFPPQAVRYTRHVTEMWCGVMLLNTLVSLYTAFWASFRVWSLYNGLLVYVVFGTVFAGEYLVRIHMKRRWAGLA